MQSDNFLCAVEWVRIMIDFLKKKILWLSLCVLAKTFEKVVNLNIAKIFTLTKMFPLWED